MHEWIKNVLLLGILIALISISLKKVELPNYQPLVNNTGASTGVIQISPNKIAIFDGSEVNVFEIDAEGKEKHIRTFNYKEDIINSKNKK